MTGPITGRVTGIVASGVTRAIGHRTRVADADALAYIAAVEAADDEALEVSIKDAYNYFIIGCKADGIWDAIKASCILAGARTLAGCLVPLVGTAPTNVGPFVTGDYNRITGLKGNGSTKHLTQNNSATPLQNSSHQAVYISENTTTVDTAFATHVAEWPTSGTDGRTQISTNTTKTFTRCRETTGNSVTSTDIGLNGVSRSNSADYIRRISLTNATISSASTGIPNQTIFVFCNPALDQQSDARLSFYSLGESLNLANLDTRVTRLLCEIEFGINTGLAGTGYDLDTLKYVNAGYAAGGTLA